MECCGTKSPFVFSDQKSAPLRAQSVAPVGFITVKDRTLTLLAERFIECARKVADSDAARRYATGRQ
jgi:hypothetical protein